MPLMNVTTLASACFDLNGGSKTMIIHNLCFASACWVEIYCECCHELWCVLWQRLSVSSCPFLPSQSHWGVFRSQAICLLIMRCRIHHPDTLNDPTVQVAAIRLCGDPKILLATNHVSQQWTLSAKVWIVGSSWVQSALGLKEFQKDNLDFF